MFKVINIMTNRIYMVYKVESVDQYENYFLVYDKKEGFHLVDSKFYAPYDEATYPDDFVRG